MAKSIKKAQLGAIKKMPFKKASASDSTMQKRYPGASPVGKKKPVTDMQRDEMGKPVSPKQKSESLKGLQESVEYKGRPKMKKGGSFPDLNKDGKITKADILKGRGVIAKKGKKVAAKKMMGGGKCKYGCK